MNLKLQLNSCVNFLLCWLILLFCREYPLVELNLNCVLTTGLTLLQSVSVRSPAGLYHYLINSIGNKDLTC